MLRYHLGQIADWFRCVPANPIPFSGYVLQAVVLGILIADGHGILAFLLFAGSALVTLTSTASTLDTYQKAKRVLAMHPEGLPPAFVRAHQRYWCRRQALKLVERERVRRMR